MSIFSSSFSGAGTRGVLALFIFCLLDSSVTIVGGHPDVLSASTIAENSIIGKEIFTDKGRELKQGGYHEKKGVLLSRSHHVIESTTTVANQVSEHSGEKPKMSTRNVADGTVKPSLEPTVPSAPSPSFTRTRSSASCEDGLALLKLTFLTDCYPRDYFWEIKNVLSGEIVHESGIYEDAETPHEESYCLEEDNCYEYTMFDSYYDGISGNGYVQVYYESVLILEGSDDFEESITSIQFGSGCISQSPSISHHPSLKKTDAPSLIPSLSSPPTTDQLFPTEMPTLQEDVEYSIDKYGRRHFPSQVELPNKRTNHELPANCASGNVGCIQVPGNASPPPLPHWYGQIYFKPPTCKFQKATRSRLCDFHFPMSRNVYPDIKSNFELNDDGLSGLDGLDRVYVTSIATSDMDGDGDIDIVVGVGGKEHQNQILLNNGNGSFEYQSLPLGSVSDTTAVAIGDINGDDMPDILIANFESANFLLINKGSGFEKQELSGGFRTTSVAIADVDGNGKLDCIFGNEGEDNMLLLNQGHLDFNPVILPGTSTTQTSSVVAGDLNGNHKCDIVFGNRFSQNQVLFNQGNNTFLVSELESHGSETFSIAIGDIDGDKALDLVVGTSADVPNKVLRNAGDSTFETIELEGGNFETRTILLCDLDGDGMVDIVAGNKDSRNEARNKAFINQGSNRFSWHYLPGGGSETNALAAGHLDESDNIVLVIGNEDKSQLLSNSPVSSFVQVNLPFPLRGAGNLAVADMDGNGYLDLITWDPPTTKTQVHLNQGTNSEFTTMDIGDSLTENFAIADLNQDHFPDLVSGHLHDQKVLLNSGNSSFTKAIPFPFVLGYTAKMLIADMNGDGQNDIILANREEGMPSTPKPHNYILYNSGNGTFEPMMLPGAENILPESMAVCDLDEDNQLDLIIGTDDGNPNLLFKNKGNNSFTIVPLPGSSSKTKHIAVADVDKNGFADVVLIHSDTTANQILLNDGGDIFTPSTLGGGSKNSLFASIGDLDGNGLMDIVVANDDNDSNQILWNMGGGNFVANDLPGEITEPTGCKLADINGDGTVDILISNKNAPIQVLLYNQFGKSCDNGGARLHSGSWCMTCPSFMGRPTFFNKELSTCVECLPDHEQSNFAEQCNSFPCPFAQRPMGVDSCAECPSGTFYDSTIQRNIHDMPSLDSSRCHECPSGQYSDLSVLAIDECFQCSSGSHQPNSGRSSCAPCGKGFFQPDRGQDNCIACEVGGYCDAIEMCGGGFTSCPAGTYNDQEGQSDASACKSCPAGTFGTVVGATDVSICKPCPKGSFTSEDGQTQCQLCLPGTHQPDENQQSCLPCAPGTYASNPGLVECTRCPTQLFSSAGSETCSFCHEEYYLADEQDVDVTALIEKPDKHCLFCPTHAECPMNTTLQSLVVPSNFWRDSPTTSTLYQCNNKVCQKSNTQTKHRISSSSEEEEGSYCSIGHTGPLCEVCLDSSNYFSSSAGRCQECPSLWRLAIPVCVVITIITVFIASRYIKGCKGFTKRLVLLSSQTSLQAKFKLLISFYQVVNTLEDVYGVTIDDELKQWFDFLQFFNFGLIELTTIPGGCFGDMKTRLIMGGLWPYFATTIIFGGIVLYVIIVNKQMRRSQSNNNQNSSSGELAMRLVTVAIIISYMVLPSVCRSIFDAIKCQSFDTNDQDGSSTSYLIADWSIQCGQQSAEHQELLQIFWTFFSLWPILVPLVFLGLLMRVRDSVRSKSITPLAQASSFLWRDYTEATMFWEVIDVIRKILLTGLIMFVDIENGSTKILRLIIAIVVSTFYLSILAYARPYQRHDDLCLAFISNLLIICCFVLGIVIQQCHNDDEMCREMIGLSFDSYRASVLAVIVTAAMLVVTALFMLILGLNAITTPTIKITRTTKEPNMEMAGSCRYHVFCSHVWATGQDKTHAMTRKLQLLLPEIKVWLDVNNLTDIGCLESSVDESAIFVLFYTKGYFASANCRREVNTALTKKKPTIVLFEKYGEIDELRRECEEHCRDNYWLILDHILAEDPVMWLGRSPLYFAVESVKVLSMRILRHLPYYVSNPNLLDEGLTIESELGEVLLPKEHQRRILFCSENEGVDKIAEELVGMAALGDSVTCAEVDTILGSSTSSFDVKSDFLILYLKNGIFRDAGGQMKDKVKSAIQAGLKIILLHEQDPDKGGLEFKFVMVQTPDELMSLKLYDDMALPLHTHEDYRKISLRQVLCKVGGRPKNSTSKFRALFGLNSAAGGVASLSRRRLSVTFGRSIRRLAWRRSSTQSSSGSNQV